MHTFLRTWKHWAFLTAALLLVNADAQAQNLATLNLSDNVYDVEFLGSTDDGENTTFSYRVTERRRSNDLSNWILELCVDADLVIAVDPDESDPEINDVEIGFDPVTGLTGIKWDFEGDDFDGDGEDKEDSRLFSFTLKGLYGETPVQVAGKSGPGSDTELITGPSCETTCDPSDGPFWDGNFTGGDPGPGEGYFQIQTPQGFERIELTVHDNIAITGLADAGGATINEVDLSEPLSGSEGSGYRVMKYVGGDVLTDVRILVRALEQSESQFMYQVTDGCEITGQFDPRVQLAMPASVSLDQNYPNPFNPQTSIRFKLPEASSVKLVVYNVLGREVKTLLQGELGAGDHEALWDGTDSSGLRVPSGSYLYRLEAGNVVHIRQMTMLK